MVARAGPAVVRVRDSDSLTPVRRARTLVAVRQLCEIVLRGGAQNIVVSKPFAGPTGGSVVPLAAARKKFKSPCLYGQGPKFVVMGTNRANSDHGGQDR